MEDTDFILMIIDLLDEYIQGRISARIMIAKYDELIRNHFPWDTKNKKMKSIERFQDKLALFVENGDSRKEDENYFGVLELNNYVSEFLKSLKE